MRIGNGYVLDAKAKLEWSKWLGVIDAPFAKFIVFEYVFEREIYGLWRQKSVGNIEGRWLYGC